MTTAEHREILTGSRSWSATPQDYSSMRFLQFAADGTGLVVYGYGQTIYAKETFEYELSDDTLELRLDGCPEREISYELLPGDHEFRESVTGAGFRFSWLLRLATSPFPDGPTYPYGTPLVFYGYRESVEAT